MPFGFDPVSLVRKELLKFDPDHDGIPQVIEALDGVEAGLALLADFTDDFDAEEAEAVLNIFNSCRKLEKRRTPDEIRDLANKVVMIAPGLRAAKAALEKIEVDLRK
jgi:hypothetical protein